ncbi:MAG: EAL domain-containing protein [Pseudoxanthomonas sp.]|nr:EAL domain-containing protein [Pseudoxanthomonas sp.]
MPAAPEVSRGEALRASPAWALLVMMVGLLFTAVLARNEWLEARANAEAMQRSLADAAPARVREPLESAAQALRAMQTVFLSNDRMDQQVFAQYQDNLRTREQVTGFVATAFAQRLPGAGMPGSPAYRYEYVWPMAGNEALVGLDIATQPQNLSALYAARDADAPALSAPFPLRQFSDAHDADARGITVRLPVYSRGLRPMTVAIRRAREIGALAVSLRLEPMLQQALQGRILDDMHLEIVDLDALPRQAAVFVSDALPDGAPAQVRRMDFGGRRWELRLWPRTSMVDTDETHGVIAAGSTISVLLALLMLSQATTQRRALDLGRRMSSRFGESEARFRVLNELLPALVLLADSHDGRVVYANQAAREHLGATPGAPLLSLFADPMLGGRAMAAAGDDGHWASQEVMVAAAGGDAFWASAALARVEVDGASHLLMVASDTTEQRELTERLRYQAAHDGLTELCNRREFERRLQEALATRAGRAPFALLYIDLDQFKLINDVSGHMAGDQLLVQLVHAMRGHLRPGDLLARLGGDEFGLLAFDVDTGQAQALAEGMRRCIEGVMFIWQGRSYAVSASIGMVMVDRDGCTLKDLLAWADSACYQAKEAGRNRVCMYREDEDTTRRRSEMEWANRLRWALEQDRLLLDYQEVVPLLPPAGTSLPGTHIELLLRLREEDGTVFLPGAFIPAAERYGLMPAVDRWVIGTALANFARLHPCGSALRTCAINLSGASIEDEGLADFILGAIARHGVPATQICLEITETVAVRNLLRVVGVMERLRAAGCRIALDDFGAGMSSFGYLKNLPVDVIKIDGSFVRDLGSDPMSRAIVNAVAQIGHQRGLKVVAEWVDGEHTLAVLRELGVDYGQGFILHRPQRVLFQRPDGGAAGRRIA